MSPLTLREFVTGRGPSLAPGPWHPLAAVAVAVVVLAAGQLAPIAVWSLLLPVTGAANGTSAGLSQLDEPSVALALLASQILMAALTVAFATRGGDAAATLRLVPPIGGWRTILYGLLLMVPLLCVVNALAYALSPQGFAADFRQLLEIARSASPWLTFAAIGIGAPIWEEVLFRGFVLAPLASGLGFWPAAAVVSAAWTALHANYSIAGLTEVFAIGFYFAWLLRRTGSLWVPIACHAAYNAGLFLALRWLG